MSLLRKTRQRGTGEAPCIACAGTGKVAPPQSHRHVVFRVHKSFLPTTPDSHFTLTLPSSLLFSQLPSRPKWTACTAENRPKKGAPGPAAPSRPSEPAAATAPHPSFTVTGCAIASGGAGGVPIPQARGGAATRFRGGRTLPMVCAPPCPIAADEPRP